MGSSITFHRRREGASNQVVIFVHGFTGDPIKTWEGFPELLESEPSLSSWDICSIGFRSNSTWPDFPIIWSGNPQLDTLALRFCTTMQLHQEYDQIAIIAHSMGGLIMQRALLETPTLSDRVKHLFLFATPSLGLAKAGLLSSWNRQCWDMYHDSDFITNLRRDWDAKYKAAMPFQLVTVAGDVDDFVPLPTCHDAFPDLEGTVHKLVIPGHHLDIVKPGDRDHLGYKVVAQMLSQHGSPPELTESQSPRDEANQPADQPRKLRVFQSTQAESVVQNALELDKADRQSEAIHLLEEHLGKGKPARKDTDAMGVLAGRLKRRWYAQRSRDDARRALELYQGALQISERRNDLPQMYYHAINVAFLALAFALDYPVAQRFAFRAQTYCRRVPMDSIWPLATLGESHLYLRDNDKAFAAYERAMALHPSPREIRSMRLQAMRVADLLEEQQALAVLATILREPTVEHLPAQTA